MSSDPTAAPDSYSVRFYLIREGHGYITDPVTFILAEYMKLEKDYLSFLSGGQPKGGTYSGVRSNPKVDTTVVLDFRSVAAFGGF